MHPDLVQLVLLQEVDQQIARLTAEIGSLPSRLKAAEARLADARAAVKNQEEILKTEEAARRRMQGDVNDHKIKIGKYKDQTNTVKNNDQYKALLHEIEFAEAAIRQIEDGELQSMVRTETAEAEKLRATIILEDEEKVAARERQVVRTMHMEDQAELTTLRIRRQELRPGIPPQTLAIYDRVSASRKTGLAEALGQRCSACQMQIRPQKWNELRSDVLMTCESCGRLLYYVRTYATTGTGGPPAEVGVKKSVRSSIETLLPERLPS